MPLTKLTLDHALAALTRMVERAEQRTAEQPPKRKPTRTSEPLCSAVEYADKTA